MIVAVGTTNEAKIKPVNEIFSHYFSNPKVIGAKVESGVSEQPYKHEEIYQGALNRATRALQSIKNADYGVGIEGGLDTFSYGMFEFTIVVIIDKKGTIGKGISSAIEIPKKVQYMFKDGKNLEDVVFDLFQIENAGEKMGYFGIMTKGLITRSDGIRQALALALAPFLHENLY